MPPRKTKAASKAAAPKSSELSLIEDLAEILNRTGLTEIEIDRAGARVRVSKSAHVAMSAAAVQHHPAPMVQQATLHHGAPVVAAATTAENKDALKSPMVGTVYTASTPGTPPFVAVGSQVKQGQTVLIIEAMKTMNQIAATKSGTVTAILVDNGQPVEFGEALMVIE
jgi:acetyl-CoA carboxylase biotin carboxyl carrier protein